jgi:hypothetical protein
MRKFLMAKLVSLMLIGTAWAGTGLSVEQLAKVEQVATAIARTEGFFKKGTLPNRLHNPGDIKSLRRDAYPGQTGLYHGYVVFKNDKAGWRVLENQITAIVLDESKEYTRSMTFGEIAKVYAASPQWPKTFCKILQISPDMTFNEYFNLPPRILFTEDMRHGKLPVWSYGRPQMPVLQPMPELLAQVR